MDSDVQSSDLTANRPLSCSLESAWSRPLPTLRSTGCQLPKGVQVHQFVQSAGSWFRGAKEDLSFDLWQNSGVDDLLVTVRHITSWLIRYWDGRSITE